MATINRALADIELADIAVELVANIGGKDIDLAEKAKEEIEEVKEENQMFIETSN